MDANLNAEGVMLALIEVMRKVTSLLHSLTQLQGGLVYEDTQIDFP